MPSPLLPAEQRQDALARLGDAALVELARAGDEPAIRTLVRRHNQRLFRVARAIVRTDGEAEDVVQASYVKAFTHLDGFRGEALLVTWLTRLAISEAGGRLGRRRPTAGLDAVEAEQGRSAQIIQFPTLATPADPETEMSRQKSARCSNAPSTPCPMASASSSSCAMSRGWARTRRRSIWGSSRTR